MPCQIFVQHLLLEAVRSSTRGIIKKKPTEIPSKEVAMQTAVCHWLWPQGIGFPYSDGNTLWVDWSCPPPPCGRDKNCTRQQQSCRLFSYGASTTVAVQVIDVFRMCLADAPFNTLFLQLCKTQQEVECSRFMPCSMTSSPTLPQKRCAVPVHRTFQIQWNKTKTCLCTLTELRIRCTAVTDSGPPWKHDW